MIRYYYGPWDRRYYHVLAALESRLLIEVKQTSARSYSFTLTELGLVIAQIIAKDDSFARITTIAKVVNKHFGARSGSYLERLVYEKFYREIGERQLGEEIRK